MIAQILDSATCLACQGCCRFSARDSVWSPLLLKEEMSAGVIPADMIGINRRIRLVADTLDRCFVCPLLNVKDDTCSVYDRRPFECRLYPFVLAATNDGVWLAVDPHCPFVEQHAHEPDFKEYAAGLAAFFESAQGRGLLEANSHLAQEYTGVLLLTRLIPPQKSDASPHPGPHAA